ncbi:MAG: hypothetical protein KDE27_18920, partial [Planctomycetes bacterium]|nr:hypothetical protein [Planctomycetota bacterium]
CRDLPHGAGAPASVDLQVPEGAAVRIAADYEDVPGGNPVLFAESFDAPFGPPATFTPLDLASGGSSWLVVDGALTQRTNIGDGGSPTWLGSLALAGNPAWTDVTLSARINSRDNDSCGLVFRYRDAGNFYRLRLDNERQTTQLTSFRNGTPRLLAELPGVAGYTTNAWFTLTVAAIGSHLRVLKDGVELFDVTDTDHAIGRIGLYTWADQLVAFDDVVVRAGDATGRTRNRFFAADFASGSTAGFTFVDQGATSAPSAWSVQGGALRQTSNINDGDGSRAGLPKLGTLALGGGVYGDQELHVRLRSDDDDAIGAVLRYQGPADHYRFSVDAERHYRRLVRVVGGQWTLLWEDDHDFLPGFWNELQFSALGDRLRVVWNGQTLCEVRDASIPNGRAGLYCWASTPVAFDDFVVQEPPQRRAVTVATAVGNQDALQLAAPASAGELYVLALAFSRLPGQAMAAFQAGDPRIWELTNDPLFQASLSPSPYLQNFVGVLDPDGHGDATIVFPAVVSQLLGGVELYAGGVTYDFGTNRFGELLPTVAVRVP